MRHVRLLATAFITLLLALAPVAHAQTLDSKALSRKPEPRAPKKPGERAGEMKACSEYGAGFYRLSGSDTCVRVGGGVSVGVGSAGVR